MTETSPSRTSATLLGRLKQNPTDQAAWGEFVDRYGGKIYGWCRRWNLQDADAEDVTQNVLARLADKIRTFAYDSSRRFRSWLRTLTQHALSDFVESRERPGQGAGGSHVLARLHTLEARDDLVARLEEEFDREVLDKALGRVRQQVGPQKWEVFRLMALEGVSGAEVAKKLDMKVATAFTVRSKVQQKVKQEIQRLNGGSANAPEDSP